jgi:hypothetical protein
MSSRIGTLHLRYRARRGGPLATAVVPGLDRAMRARLGEALEGRLATILGDDPAVIVIRELNARVAIGRDDWSLDSRAVDRISRASADAVSAALSAPASAEAVMRFADQAEFIGSFIVDLLNASAWDRWYYGAFQRYRQSDAAGTIRAVLDDHAGHAAAVFGWLARRGQLGAVLALLGAREARRLAGGGAEPLSSSSRAEVAPLVTAAFLLLEALGWRPGDEGARTALVAAYLEDRPLPPTWSDARSLTAWVMGLMQFAARTLSPRGTTRREPADDSVRELLAGQLDWLDAAWLAPQLDELCDSSSAQPPAGGRASRRVLTRRHEEALDRLAGQIGRGRIRIDRSDGRDGMIVRLLAAIAAGGPSAALPDAALLAVVERIAAAWSAAIASGVDARLLSASGVEPGATASLLRGHAALAARVAEVRAAGPAAVAVLQQLLRAAPADDEAGDSTRGATLFLLARGILDVRLDALAHAAGVPFEPLLAALAYQWLRLTPPFDKSTAVWVGAERPALADLDAHAAGLSGLQHSLLEVLHDQRALAALPPDEALDAGSGQECSPATLTATARIAWLVLHAWSRWLPGVGASSPAFLIRNCLQREGRVRATDSEIAVRLDPAPLDVVLEMAGYFRPIEIVPWLNRRRVSFRVAPRPGA